MYNKTTYYICADLPNGRGRIYQLYRLIWYNKDGVPSGISVSFTTFTDLRHVSNEIKTAISKPPKLKEKYRGCSSREKVRQGWYFVPEEARSFEIYGHSALLISQIKWVVRRKLDAICVLKTLDSLFFS